ncbi:MAG: YCF48-related protein, partial [Ignavibacteria bacterium]
MVSPYTGYIAGWFTTILKTTNGGNNWVVLQDGIQGQANSYNGASFINSQTGWICGFSRLVIRTTNGGVSWDSVPVSPFGTLRDILFLSGNTGWTCSDGGLFYLTTNGGNNWTYIPFSTSSNFTSLHFINLSTGWVISEQESQVFRTTNGGYNWELQAVLPSANSYFIFFPSTQIGWAGGAFARIYKSTSGGYNWVQENVNPQGFVGNVHFLNDSVGWGACGNGKIIHTTNGGEPLTVKKISGEIPESFELYQNYPNPFNSRTIIEFDIIKTDFYKLEIYNLIGQKVDELMNGYKGFGKYRIEYDAFELSSGIYLYELSSLKQKSAKKFTLAK